ncbi:cell division protein [Corynebacterium silvaticum]|uniref:cell division protein n=1 Tax=Corynebacterium silvaticum TaxID=2320431 RepID=UPI001067C21C|nr:cell division protein [Corynebacterium silvaticum]MBH5299860.1 cell division protein [Corynebacterium silvaticum]NOM65752.1 cell division protein [Corynebacterium silvaticum]TFA91564.1 cell division protein [Corynebacterium silvaticum]TFA92574.1 cell division protein [Corynebacterium silvaticum]TNX78715.1 cell division protein [Corynebacterium silvaticum]
MSELHLEITELIEAGINVHNTHDTLREARVRGYRLVVRVIEYDPNSFLQFVASWFGEEVAA